jgi:hypothetical protein
MIGFVMAPLGGVVPHIVKSTGEVILSVGLIGLSYALITSTGGEKSIRLISD